ncbi:MAG: hypothetical protein DWI58_02550 [Chloroflexi bacterium]|nr:MAG: hypothetical protein DWI58_02550 [Chloroflexota bacterium]
MSDEAMPTVSPGQSSSHARSTSVGSPIASTSVNAGRRPGAKTPAGTVMRGTTPAGGAPGAGGRGGNAAVVMPPILDATRVGTLTRVGGCTDGMRAAR